MTNDKMPDEIWVSEWCKEMGAPDSFSYGTCHNLKGGDGTRYTRADRPDPELAEVREKWLQVKDTSTNWKYAVRKPVTSYADDLIAIEGIADEALAILDRKIGGA